MCATAPEDDSGEDELELPNIGEFLEHLLGGDREAKSLKSHGDTLRRHVPTWDGALSTPDDLVRLFVEIRRAFPNKPPTKKVRDQIKEATSAIIGSNMGMEILQMLSTRHADLDFFAAIEKVWNTSEASLNAIRSAADAKRKWTPEIAEIATPIFQRHLKPPKVKKHAAAQRTWAELKRDHGIELSLQTVKRGLGVIK